MVKNKANVPGNVVGKPYKLAVNEL